MAWPTPQFTKGELNRAGDMLRSGGSVDSGALKSALEVLNNWRSCHGYPINTFQATLRDKLKSIDPDAIVAQRMKRLPSIVSKLRRFDTMNLTQMQDIGGLRAVVGSMRQVRNLEESYRASQFRHELVLSRDYVRKPKTSGYRSVHLVYRYRNPRAPDYNGLLIELQIRTRQQHIWATAVETMGTFLNHALKSSEGPEEWLSFFALTGSAFARLERCAPVPGYERLSAPETYVAVSEEALRLTVRERLDAFSLAAHAIHADKRVGSFYLVVLDLSRKHVQVKTFSQANLDRANVAYSKAERRITEGEDLQAVLVSASSIENLRRAYPSYFLDTHEFLQKLDVIDAKAQKAANKSLQRTAKRRR